MAPINDPLPPSSRGRGRRGLRSAGLAPARTFQTAGRFGPWTALTLLAALAVVPVQASAQAVGKGGATRGSWGGREVVFPLDLDAAPRPRASAVRAPGPVEVDGILDDAAWGAAPVIDEFIQQRPAGGWPATERTEVRILYDDENLYIGAELHDSDPAGLIIPTLQRDPNTRDGDAFGLSIDTFGDGSSSFSFFINPGGAIRDSQTSDDGRINNGAWDGAYDLRTRIHDGGWTLEMAIPWSTLRFEGGGGDQRWGLNLLRRIRRKNEDATWAPMDRQWQLYVMSRAGRLDGITGVEAGRNLSVKPYVLSARPSGDLRVGEPAEFDAGVDLKYGLTPSMTLDLTLNTDFSQVEVDQQQVNLTRFSLFFPEKREFFLENQGIFQFGDLGQMNVRTGVNNQDFTLFHSRRIGLTPAGTPLPILGGGRVSGTAGPLEVGVLTMQTREEGESGAENFAVARVRGRPAAGLGVGAIVVNRSATGGGDTDQRSYGVDLNWQGVNDYLLVQSYLAATDGTGPDGVRLDRGWAGRVSVGWRDPRLEFLALYRQFDDDFSPAVGFVRRTGMRHGYATAGIKRRPSVPGVLEVNPYVEANHFEGFDGRLQTRDVKGGLDVDLVDGSILSLGITDRFEQVDEAFSVRGATVDVGAYDFTEWSASLEASRARAVSGRLNLSGGGFFGGDRVSVGGNLQGRLGYRLIADLSVDHNRIDLPGLETVTADVFGLKVQGFASTRLLASAFVQYNEATEELVSNLRFNWIHAPLSDLFLVLTERRDTANQRVLDRVLSFKVTRMVSF